MAQKYQIKDPVCSRL